VRRAPHAVVGAAHVGARVSLARRLDQQVAEQQARVVVSPQVLAVLGPGDQQRGAAARHALQHQPLAPRHYDGPGGRRVGDAGRLRGGTWGGGDQVKRCFKFKVLNLIKRSKTSRITLLQVSITSKSPALKM